MNESKDFETKIKRIKENLQIQSKNSSNVQEELVIQAHNLKKAMKTIEHLASAQKDDAEQQYSILARMKQDRKKHDNQ